MHLQRVRIPGPRGCRMTGGRWLACAGLAVAGGFLLVACAEPPAPLASRQATDPSAVAADPRSGPEATEPPDAVDDRSAGEASAVDAGGAGASAHDVQNAEAEMDADAERDAEPPEGAGRAEAVEVTTPPEPGSGTEALPDSPQEMPDSASDPPDVSPDPPDAPSDPLPEPSLVAGPIVLPPAQPVTGTDVKLNGVLLELVRARRQGGEAGVLAYVEQHRPGLSVDHLHVEVVCTSAETGTWVREQIEAAGGTVTASLENHIWADLSLDGVETLVAAEAVWTISVSQVVVEPMAR